MAGPTVHLIPIALAEDGYHALPGGLPELLDQCQAFFAENLRTARRAFRKIHKSFDIDSKIWFETGQKEEAFITEFKDCLKKGLTIGIVSESGCPGIADPGQRLVAIAHESGAIVKPFSGPSSILLALMASGLNGQHFTFNGYLPINPLEREKKIRELERRVVSDHCTQIFIETPYRNQQLFQSLIKSLQPATKLCIAFHLTAADEWVKTKSISIWKKSEIDLPKEPAIFLIGE